MKYILFLLLICSTATAQTVRVATSTATTAPTVYSRAGTDTAKDALRREIAALRAEITALRSAVIQMTPGAADTLRNINRHLTDMRNRTEAVNTNWWRADQALINRIDSSATAHKVNTTQISGIRKLVEIANDMQINLSADMELYKIQLSDQVKKLADTQGAQQAVLNKVEAWIRNY